MIINQQQIIPDGQLSENLSQYLLAVLDIYFELADREKGKIDG
jgi:hypothetical protein